MMPRKQGQSKGVAEDLVPGTSITARVKGYPAWPAIVVAEQDLPEQVRKAKPNKKFVVPVLFYNDNSFLWISPQDGELLTKEQAEKNSKAKVKRRLRDAYTIAANPPQYETLIAKALGAGPSGGGSEDGEFGTKSSKVEDDHRSQLEATSEPASRSRRARSAVDRAREEASSRPKTSTRKRLRGEVSEPSLVALKPKKGKLAEASDVEEDSEYVDFGTEETDGNTTGVETDGGLAEDLEKSQQARFELCSSIRQSIQEKLLIPGTKFGKNLTAEVENALRQLDEAPEIELSVARRSKLVRVVFNALSLANLPQALREKLDSWAQRWDTKAEPVIRGIPEDLAPREETEEPEDYNVSVNQSREPTEAPEGTETAQIETAASLFNPSNQEMTAETELATPSGDSGLADLKQEGDVADDADPKKKKVEEPIRSL